MPKRQPQWVGGTPEIGSARKSENRETLPFPLGRDYLDFYSARYALYHGLESVGLKADDGILAPSYCCGTEIDPLLFRKLVLHWYQVDGQLRVSLDSVRSSWRPGVKALLVNHFFGFNGLSEEVVSFCRERGLLIIEDCAHAFLSASDDGRALGSKGDFAVFSLRKSLGTPDGGALVVNGDASLERHITLREPNPWPILYRTTELISQNSDPLGSRARWLRWLAARSAGRLFTRTRVAFRVANKVGHVFDDCLIHPNDYAFSASAVNWRMSKFSRTRVGGKDWSTIVSVRRRNFEFLLRETKRFPVLRPLFDSLEPGTCPLLFPTVIDEREAIHEALFRLGVDSHVWWAFLHPAVPWDSFPEARYLKSNLLGFPIHQGLEITHMERIIETLVQVRKTTNLLA